MRRFARGSATLTTLICLSLFVLADGLTLVTDTRWVGELGWTPEWANAGLYLGGCLLAGVSAFLSTSYFTPTFLAVVGANSTGRRVRVVASVWVRNLGFGVAGHLVILIIAVVATVVTAPTDALRWEPFLYALLPIVIFVSLGTLISALVPNIVGSALAIAIAYLVAFNVASGLLRAPLLVGGEEVTLVGLDYDRGALIQWSVLAAFATLVLLVGSLVVIGSRSTGVAITATLTALVLAFAGPSLAGVHLLYRFHPSSTEARFFCAGHSPVVCLAAGHTRHLARVARQVDNAARPLIAAGVTLTDATVFEPQTADRDSRLLLSLDRNSLNADSFTNLDLSAALSRPTECSQYESQRDSQDLLTVGGALTQWVAEHLDPPLRPSHIGRLPDSWVRAAFVALRDCSVPTEVLAAWARAK